MQAGPTPWLGATWIIHSGPDTTRRNRDRSRIRRLIILRDLELP
jgi:hypothetical protein